MAGGCCPGDHPSGNEYRPFARNDKKLLKQETYINLFQKQVYLMYLLAIISGVRSNLSTDTTTSISANGDCTSVGGATSSGWSFNHCSILVWPIE